MFRVYDNKEKCWIEDDIYLSPYGELYKIKQSLFGLIKTPILLDNERYIFHQDIKLQDKNGVYIYEGDYIQAQVDENKVVVGFVAYAYELSSYVILCADTDEFYTLGSNISELIQVVGNVFEGYEVVQDGEQALQGSEK